MSRGRSVKRDEAYKLWKESNGQKKMSDIAKTLGISASQLRNWKAQDCWESKTTQSIKKNEFDCTKHDKEQRKEKNKAIVKKVVEAVEDSKGLTEKQRLFCIYYASNNNATQSYLKAYGSSYASAMTEGYASLRKPHIKAEVKRLKEIIRVEIDFSILDFLNYCVKVVSADIGDYVTFGQRDEPLFDSAGAVLDEDGKQVIVKENYVIFGESNRLDTSVISEVRCGKSGTSIKLADKNWAWEQLIKYFDWLPDKHRRTIDNERLRLEKLKTETNTDDIMVKLDQILGGTKHNLGGKNNDAAN